MCIGIGIGIGIGRVEWSRGAGGAGTYSCKP